MPLPPSPPNAPLSLHQLSQLKFWDAFLALPAPVEAAIIAAVISLPLGIATLIIALRSLAVAKQAKEVAQQKLFADLLKVRMEWHESFKNAVSSRKKELVGDLETVVSQYESESTRLLEERQHESHWFFDAGVTSIVNDVITEFQSRRTKIIEGEQILHSVANKAKQQAKHHAFNVEQLMRDLSRALKPFLFVGHIKQTIPEAKAGPRIGGIFRGL